MRESLLTAGCACDEVRQGGLPLRATAPGVGARHLPLRYRHGASSSSLLLIWLHEAGECRPSWIGQIVCVSGIAFEPNPANGAQARAILATHRGQGQAEHHRVAPRRPAVDAIFPDPRQRIFLIIEILARRTTELRGRVDEQLAEIHRLFPVERLQATRAFRIDMDIRSPGDQYAVHDGLQSKFKVDGRPFGHIGQCNAHAARRLHRSVDSDHRPCPLLQAQRTQVKDKRAGRVEAVHCSPYG